MTGSTNNCGLSVCTNMISSHIKSSVVGCIDTNDFVKKMQIHNPKIAIIEALWIKSETLNQLKIKFKNTKFYIHLHSNLCFLSIEPYAMTMINQYMRDGYGIIFNNINSYNSFKKFENIYYLPNIYDKHFHEIKIKESEVLDVGCFGSVRPMKNHVMQAAASVMFAEKINKRLRFHVNLTRDEDNGESVKRNLAAFFQIHNNHELVSQSWKSQHDFIESIKQMDISLQVSMSETYNIVCADTVAAGVPLVTSHEVEWVQDVSYAKHSDPEDICSKMELVIKSPLLININRHNLNVFNDFAKKKWSEFIDG